MSEKEILYTVSAGSPQNFVEVDDLVKVLDVLQDVKPQPGGWRDLTQTQGIRSALFQSIVMGYPVSVVRTEDGRVFWDSDVYTPPWFHTKYDLARQAQSERKLKEKMG